MTAGIETLKLLKRDGFYREPEEKSARLSSGIAEAVKKAAFPIYSTRVGSMLCAFFSGGEVRDWMTASARDTGAFARYFRAMLEHGIYLAPSQFETVFVYTDEDIEKTIKRRYRHSKISRKYKKGKSSGCNRKSSFMDFAFCPFLLIDMLQRYVLLIIF